ncbi:MAG: hypothetical protein RDV48_31405 [Candidatus Eremiobacteraeota bacterium]|nr:hypothetical protein [Candidatus Eremiobacteraeota bacterium]
MIGTLENFSSYSSPVSSTVPGKPQAPTDEPSGGPSEAPTAMNDSVDIEEEGDDGKGGSKPDFGWLSETGGSGDDASALIAKETGKGPDDTKATWDDPVKYREKLFQNKISDPLLQKAFDGVKDTLDREFKDYKKNDKGWNCYGWRDKFLSIKADKNGEKLSTVNTAMMDKLSDAVKKATGQRPQSITPYYQTIPNEDYQKAKGHTYVYLQVKFDNGKEQWIFTEANASVIPSLGDGCVHYQTRAVNRPEHIETLPQQKKQQQAA